VTQELRLQAAEGVFDSIAALPGVVPEQVANVQQKAAIRNSYALVGMLFTPVAVVLFAFAIWALLFDLNAASTFPYASGPLSHWMVWCAMALAVRGGASAIERLVSR